MEKFIMGVIAAPLLVDICQVKNREFYLSPHWVPVGAEGS